MKRIIFATLAITVGFAAGLVLTGRLHTSLTSDAAPVGQPEGRPSAPGTMPLGGARAGGGMPDFTEVAAEAVRTVTNISSLQVTRQPNSPFANDPFFRYFFGDEGDMFGWRDRREASLGSGVIVSADGYVLTNNHVVGDNTQQVTVALPDKRELRAKIIGLDQWTDIALLKIDAKGLSAIPWGDSSKLKVAEWVLAIGNPFQLSQTVTLGIVSAVGRANVGVATYEDFIQTDAAINPGNSGGALVNARGELVGINTAIYSQSGGYQGVGFAVPSNLAKRVMMDLIKFGEVRRGSLGYIEITPITTSLAEQLGLPNERGALVSRMSRDSAAYSAGIRPGDALVSFNGTPVDDASHFLRLLSDAAIGSTVTIGAYRDGRKIEVRAQIQSSAAPRRGRQ
jgi:Do/DeqQ family serine protease